MILYLDHVNIHTARVDVLVDFYCGLLGLTRGPRPPFGFGGAWLYCGDKAVVHLVEMAAPPASASASASAPASVPSLDPERLALSHFAFRARGRAELLARLQAAGVPWRIGHLPGAPVVQVNISDPDGNALHIDFHDD